MRQILRGVALCVLLTGAAPAITTHYVNARFGFSADIPASLVPGRPPDNGDGQAYHSADGGVELLVYAGGNANEQPLAWHVALSYPDCKGGRPSYLDLHADWGVLSCEVAPDRILYQKTMMRGQGMDATLTTLRMTYPATQRDRWDSVAVAATRSLQAAPAWQ